MSNCTHMARLGARSWLTLGSAFGWALGSAFTLAIATTTVLASATESTPAVGGYWDVQTLPLSDGTLVLLAVTGGEAANGNVLVTLPSKLPTSCALLGGWARTPSASTWWQSLRPSCKLGACRSMARNRAAPTAIDSTRKASTWAAWLATLT
jgi:hypothetical protein